VAALTLCSLQMLLQVLPPQAAPIDRPSPRESSNRKHRLCKCVCEWMKWIQFVWHKQFNKEQLLEPNKSNWQTLNNDFKGWFSYSQGTITKSTTSKTRGTYNMDLGSLNDTRKLSQSVFRQWGKSWPKWNQRVLFIENRTGHYAIDRTILCDRSHIQRKRGRKQNFQTCDRSHEKVSTDIFATGRFSNGYILRLLATNISSVKGPVPQ
jgi:hypothetical protein